MTGGMVLAVLMALGQMAREGQRVARQLRKGGNLDNIANQISRTRREISTTRRDSAGRHGLLGLRWRAEALRAATDRGVRACRGLFLLGLACFHGRFDVTFGPDLGLTSYSFARRIHQLYGRAFQHRRTTSGQHGGKLTGLVRCPGDDDPAAGEGTIVKPAQFLTEVDDISYDGDSRGFETGMLRPCRQYQQSYRSAPAVRQLLPSAPVLPAYADSCHARPCAACCVAVT